MAHPLPPLLGRLFSGHAPAAPTGLIRNVLYPVTLRDTGGFELTDGIGRLGSEAGKILTELLERQGDVVMAFRRGEGFWDSSEVFRSDSVTSLQNFGILTSAHGFLDDDDYSLAMKASASFLWDALRRGDLDTADLAELFRGLCLAHSTTGDKVYLQMIEDASVVLLPQNGFPDLGTATVGSLMHMVLVFDRLPRGYKSRVRKLLERALGDFDGWGSDPQTPDEAIDIAVLLDRIGLALGRSRPSSKSREVLEKAFGKRADERWVIDVMVARYVYGGDVPEGDDRDRMLRLLRRKIIYTVKSEETSDLRLICDMARSHWDEVLAPKESPELIPRIDSMVREKVIGRMNPDGGWGDRYVYRATATAGIALFNIYLVTGNETFRDAAHDAGDYIRRNIWDMSDGIFYSMDRISELFFLLDRDVSDDSYALLLENYHERLLNALDALGGSDRDRLLWYSAELCILTYYLMRMTGDRHLAKHLADVSSNLVHLLDQSVYDSSYYPWFQATILAQEVLTEEDGENYGLFKPYLARMTIDRDTTINEEISYQRYIYTYDPVRSDDLVRASVRRASGFIRKDIILNISHLIEIAKIFRLLEAGNGGDDTKGPA